MSGVGEAGPDDISTWAGVIEEVISRHPGGLIDRVVVLARTESTQDAARRMCGGRAGVLVLAGRQTAGRGRLGRSWADTSHLGVAATFVLAGSSFDDGRLSLLGGVVAKCACDAQAGAVGMRWPNDVVECAPPHRKVGGVLIEREAGLIYLGIGVNVLQRESDWSPELAPRAVSLRALGYRGSRVEVARTLLLALEMHVGSSAQGLVDEWRRHDTLVGTLRAFVHDTRRYVGTVVAVDPTNAITLRLADGREISLPARTTSLDHDGP